ncbi:response regulator transcription factor [Lujinxingia sediminis]|uniref:Response regulator transcription factor n=1 Tax=Lujinxingia sediminis TaxID=2480984 RepID=A0ABY0CN25_9DELT|nr:winged helix-turn-helix domain-containing protein [Lujinxingia sediminis]RVU41055.1 response regulator transcription factor [Lujinxingia sediminis]
MAFGGRVKAVESRARLEWSLREDHPFWLHGVAGSGKSQMLRDALHATGARVQVVALPALAPGERWEELTRRRWAGALFEAVGEPPPTGIGVGGEDARVVWEAWCAQVAGRRVILEGWEWMPPEVRAFGPLRLLERRACAGVVARGAPRVFLPVGEVVRLEVIACEAWHVEQERALVDAYVIRRGRQELVGRYPAGACSVGHPGHALSVAAALVARPPGQEPPEEAEIERLSEALGEALGRELVQAMEPGELALLAGMAALKRALYARAFWRHIDRDEVRRALEQGLLVEELDQVRLATSLLARLEAPALTHAQHWRLLQVVLDDFEARERLAPGGYAFAEDVLVLLRAFALVCADPALVEEELNEEQTRSFEELCSRIHKASRQLSARRYALEAQACLQRAPDWVLRAIPEVRLRLGQLLRRVGRVAEGDKLLRSLLRLRKHETGKRAFLWAQTMAANEGCADEAIEALRDFIASLDREDPLYAFACLTLARVLMERGAFRSALSVLEEGIYTAGADIWTLELLRSWQGMCLCFTGEPEAALYQVSDAVERLAVPGLELAQAEALHVLGTMYFELERYDHAREVLRRSGALYVRFGDVRNLKMVEVAECLISLMLGEEDPPDRAELARTPAASYWAYYQAELSFAEAVHALRSGERAVARERFAEAVHQHQVSGSMHALWRVLRSYAPLLMEGGEVGPARELVAILGSPAARESAPEEAPEALRALAGLGGDLSMWAHIEAGAPDTAGAPTLLPRDERGGRWLMRWRECWEEVLTHPSGPLPREIEAYPELGAVARAWRALAQGDTLACRRELVQSQELTLAGSLFGMVRGLLYLALGSEALPTQRAEMLAFWRSLSSAQVVEQLRYWEALQRSGALDLDPERVLSRTLMRWLTIVERWRVNGELLIDRGRGVVYAGERYHELGADTMGFAMLCFLAERQPERVPMEALFEGVWQRSFSPPSSTNSVYVTVRALRQELDDGQCAESLIGVERGEGYVLRVPAMLVG